MEHRDPSFEYNLHWQNIVQLICAPLFLSISLSQFVLTFFYNPPNKVYWTYASMFVSAMGTWISAVHVVVILRIKSKKWLQLHLMYLLLCFMPYRTLYLVLGMRYDAPFQKVSLEVSLTGLLILLGWVQIYSAVLIARLWRFSDVFYGHPRCRRRRVPLEELAGMLAAAAATSSSSSAGGGGAGGGGGGGKGPGPAARGPSPGEMAELLSLFTPSRASVARVGAAAAVLMSGGGAAAGTAAAGSGGSGGGGGGGEEGSDDGEWLGLAGFCLAMETWARARRRRHQRGAGSFWGTNVNGTRATRRSRETASIITENGGCALKKWSKTGDVLADEKEPLLSHEEEKNHHSCCDKYATTAVEE